MGRSTQVRRRVLAVGLVLAALAAVMVILPQRVSAAEPVVHGDIRVKWLELGAYDFLGAPITAELPTFDGVGRQQEFQLGTIVWHPTIGAAELHGAIRDRWREIGGAQWGYPTTDQTVAPDGVGRFNHFRVIGNEERSIYWTPTGGAQPIRGDFRVQWSSRGWEFSSLGYPVSGEFPLVDQPLFVRQNFQKGYMTWSAPFGTSISGLDAPGTTKRVVVLRCKFSDRIAEPATEQHHRELFTEAGLGTGGFADYLKDQSYGRLGLRSSAVKGWFTMNRTLAASKRLNTTLGVPAARARQFADCVDAAKAGGFTPPANSVVVVAVNASIDHWGGTNRVYLSDVDLHPELAFHELLHGLGLDHSWSDDTSKVWNGAPGEYDDWWDEMSAEGTHNYTSDRYGAAAVGLNAFGRERLGVLPAGDTRTVTPARGTSTDIQIESLAHNQLPTTPQLLKVKVGTRTLYVEYRTKVGFDRGFPADTIRIMEIKDANNPRDGVTESVLFIQHGAEPRNPRTDVTVDGVRIRFIGASTTVATVRVSR